MPYELFLALRYLRSRRRRRLARVTAMVAVFGIAIGVAALIVALALANGFRDEIQAKILSGTAHLSVMRADGQLMPEHRELSAQIREVDSVASATGTTYTGAVALGPKGSAYAVLRGIEPGAEHSWREIESHLIEGSQTPLFERTDRASPSLPAVLMGAELAIRTGVRIGETAEIIAATGQHFSSPIKRLVRVVGIFRAGLFEYDSTWIYMSLDTASAFSGGENSAGVISVQVDDIYKVKPVRDAVLARLGVGYTALDWQEANRPLFMALELERRMGLFVIGIIILIAALNIATTLILVVVERRSDIAILNAMGATSRSIMTVFMIEGALIGVLGAFLGVLMAMVACVIGNHYELVSLPGDVYSISNVPFNPNMRDALLAALVAFGLSLVATIYPARAAARVHPVAMFRDTQ
ncbi:MAG TPA: ABC transporter permease [Pyrinomonadaceae bacterium]|nr:ABC transporter permease [Pyrinomonadaceae bacterium]